MITVADIVKYCEKKQVSLEMYSDIENGITNIGFRLTKQSWTWNWFRIYNNTVTDISLETFLNDDTRLHFRQSYSQNTSKSKKSYRRGFSVMKSVKNFLDKA